MKRRSFIATAVAAVAGMALRRPKPLELPVSEGSYVLRKSGDTVEWVTVYAFGANAHVRCYGAPAAGLGAHLAARSIKGVGTQEVLPPGIRVIGDAH